MIGNIQNMFGPSPQNNSMQLGQFLLPTMNYHPIQYSNGPFVPPSQNVGFVPQSNISNQIINPYQQPAFRTPQQNYGAPVQNSGFNQPNQPIGFNQQLPGFGVQLQPNFGVQQQPNFGFQQQFQQFGGFNSGFNQFGNGFGRW
jgi:hypothetical protein